MIDALTFFAVGIVLLFVDIPSPKRADLGAQAKKSVWADIREGGVYIWRRRPLLWLLGTFTVVNLVTSPIGVFTTLLVKFNLADDWSSRGFTFETALALFGTFGSVGGFAGGLLISLWGGLKHRRVYAVVLSNIVSGITMIVFGLTSLLYLAVGMALLRAAMIPIMNAHSQAIWQAQTPRELQGRVFSVRRLIAQFTAPIGTAFAGVAGGLFDPAAVMVVLGVILVVFCALMLFNPYLLRVEDRDWLEEMATRSVADARA
jgi:MFS transporter, DHA3 family, macrolide efflux protein